MLKRKGTQLRCQLIYDSTCPFCRDTAKLLVRFIGKNRLRIVSNLSPTLRNGFSHELRNRFKKDVHFINKCSIVYSGGDAVANVIGLKKGFYFIAWMNNNITPVKKIFSILYYVIKKTKKYYNYYMG